jgi:hypothetical protein
MMVGVAFGVVGPEGGQGYLAFTLCMSIILALSGNWFYWKAVDRRVEAAWDISGGNPQTAISWLKQKGGVNLGLVLAIVAAFIFIIVSAVPPPQ